MRKYSNPESGLSHPRFLLAFSLCSGCVLLALGSFSLAEGNEADNEYTKTITNLIFPPPPNDNFANRTILTGPSGGLRFTNIRATKEAGEPLHAGNVGGASVWYSWTAPASDVATFHIPPHLTALGDIFYPLLAVYTGNTVNGLSVIASNDGSSPDASVAFSASAGVTYQIAIDGKNGMSTGLGRPPSLSWQLGPVPVYTITTNSSPSNGGLTSGGGIFPAGTFIMATATAASGFTFVNWTENGNVVSTLASYTFTLNNDRNIVANFNPYSPPISVPTPTITISSSPAVVNEGKSAAFTVSASTVNPSQPVTVNYGMGGKATKGVDYTLSEIFGQTTIPAGASSATVMLNAMTDNLKEKHEKAIMTLRPGAGYNLSKKKISATVTIAK